MTPADELRTAATLLRDAATNAIHEDHSTWHTSHTRGSRSPVVVDNPERPSVLIETWAARLEHVNRYLALIGPATGLALADLLDYHAKSCDAAVVAANRVFAAEAAERQRFITQQTNPHALAVARAILGSST